jgi:hypothetical protein
MPGGYAHLYLVNKITDRIGLLPGLLQHSFTKYFHFCELGSVSPDMPYLALGQSGQQAWADTMHYERTFGLVKVASREVSKLAGEMQLKCIAWLLGYSSHLVMDGTVHPVVELKVGPYAQNKTAHRRCELNQDAYIFPKLGYGQPGEAEVMDSGLKLCHDPGNPEALDKDLLQLWQGILQKVHPAQFNRDRPDPDLWFRKYVKMMDKVVEEGYRLIPLARHIMVDLLAATLPDMVDAEKEFYENLKTPEGLRDYEQVIDLALSNLMKAWEAIGADVVNHLNHQLAAIPDFNLDTGKDAAGVLYWWELV